MTFERKDPYLYQQQRQGEPSPRDWSSQEQIPGKFHWSMLFDSPQKIVALCLVVLVGFGVAIYTLLTPDAPMASHNDVPLIKPIQGPMKEIPSDPGGIQVPHQDKMIYQRLETQHITENEPTQLIPDVSDESYPPLEAQPNPPLPAQSSLLPPSASPEQANFEAWPKATPTHMAARKTASQPANIPVEGSLTVSPPSAIQQVPTDIPNPPAAPLAEASANAVPAQALNAMGDLTAAGPAPQEVVGEAAQPRPDVMGQTAQTSPKALSPHSFRIQIASLSSKKSAEIEKKRLWAKHKNILGVLDGKIMQVDLGNSGVRYRVVAGPISSHKKARELCSKLSAAKVGCIIMKPGT
jgi:hypothetical protein